MWVVVELHAVGDGESVTGTVRDRTGALQPFDGWLDLLRLLETGLDADGARQQSRRDG